MSRMIPWCNLVRNQEKTHHQLVCSNREAVLAYNDKMMSSLALMGGILLLCPLLAAFFSSTKAVAAPAYLTVSLLFFAMYFLHKLPAIRKYTLVELYLCFSVFFVLTIYLSVCHSPGMRATILLGAFCIMPMGFIDRPSRMNLFVAFWFAVHTVLAFLYKPLYAADDTINCLCFAILGCYLGNKIIRARLEGYEASRLLTIQNETDVLTGLSNRRKLFETLASLETEEEEKPSGFLMVDMDQFKTFNDNHGHAAGDRCLRLFGEVITRFTQNLRLNFYRYGGEEFVGIAYGYSKKELFSIAENLRLAVKSADMGGCQLTVSIGAAYCGDCRIRNYEKVIDRADQACYVAKRRGRDRVYMEHSEVKAKSCKG